MSHLQQRSAAWFEARKGKLTASNLGGALGLVNYCSRNKTFDRCMGRDPFVGNEATQHGVDNEMNAIVQYQAVTGNVVQATGIWMHPTSTWIGASPDGLIGSDGMIEVKCPYYFRKTGCRVHETVPAHYWCQVNAQLEATDRKWCDFVSWAPEGMTITRIFRDQMTFDFLLTYYGQFYSAMAAGADKPPRISKEDKERIDARISESIATSDFDMWKVAVSESANGTRWIPDSEEWSASESDMEEGREYVKRSRY